MSLQMFDKRKSISLHVRSCRETTSRPVANTFFPVRAILQKAVEKNIANGCVSAASCAK